VVGEITAQGGLKDYQGQVKSRQKVGEKDVSKVLLEGTTIKVLLQNAGFRIDAGCIYATNKPKRSGPRQKIFRRKKRQVSPAPFPSQNQILYDDPIQ
jgi:hypothetical protein